MCNVKFACSADIAFPMPLDNMEKKWDLLKSMLTCDPTSTWPSMTGYFSLNDRTSLYVFGYEEKILDFFRKYGNKGFAASGNVMVLAMRKGHPLILQFADGANKGLHSTTPKGGHQYTYSSKKVNCSSIYWDLTKVSFPATRAALSSIEERRNYQSTATTSGFRS